MVKKKVSTRRVFARAVHVSAGDVDYEFKEGEAVPDSLPANVLVLIDEDITEGKAEEDAQ